MLDSLSNLVTSFPSSKRPGYAQRSHTYSPGSLPQDSKMPAYSMPSTPKNHGRRASSTLTPTSISPASITSSTYSATTPTSASSTSSSLAQGMLSKMASGSPPSSRLATPAMPHFPSPADERATFPRVALSFPSSADAARLGVDQTSKSYPSRNRSDRCNRNLRAWF